jgi:hypothetical protein
VKRAAKRVRKLKKWLKQSREDLTPLTAADLDTIVPKHKEITKKIMENDTSFNRIGVTPDKNTVGSDAIELGHNGQKRKGSCATM